MTGYHIKLGYNPMRTDYDEMWKILKSEARKVADDPSTIIAEARRLGAPENCEDGCCPLSSYADNYADAFGSYGHPIVIIDKGGDDRDDRQIMQMASTDSGIKYHVRRAYVRLLIQAMHRHGIEVSMTVS